MNFIIDLEKNNWINEIPVIQRQEIINNYLKLGYYSININKNIF